MGIDTSIYSNIQAPKIDLPQPMEVAQKAMTLSQLGMQNQQLQYQMQTNQAMRQAYANNTDPNGNVNRAGVLSQLGRVNPQAAQGLQQSFAALDKQQAEAQAAQADAAHKTLSVTVPALEYILTQVPPEQRASVWPSLKQQQVQMGVDPSKLPDHYDEGMFKQAYYVGSQMKEQLDNQFTKAETAETTAKANEVPFSIAEKQANTRKAVAEAKKAESETYARPKGPLDGVDDPAKMVPYYVPKDHQAKAFSEIDAAENTKRMSQTILDSFDQAAKENTVLKTGAGLARTPPSVLALHQSLQPTFKDLEGTVRQAAMDNTFRNVTPAPGDLPSTVETKRRALEQYLQSKASAPTARGYGIDLSKFESTSAYKSPSKSDTAGGSSQAAGGFSLSEIKAELARRNGRKGN